MAELQEYAQTPYSAEPAYTTHVVVAPHPSSVQPFGYLGGAPQLIKTLLADLLMGRLNAQYAVEAVQNAQLLLLTFDGPQAEEDVLLQSVRGMNTALAADVPTREALYPGFSALLARTPEHAAPAWIPSGSTGSGGKYAKQYSSFFATLQAQQRVATVVEKLSIRQVVAERDAAAGGRERPPLATALSAYVALSFERARGGTARLKYLTRQELEMCNTWVNKRWAADISVTPHITANSLAPEAQAECTVLLGQLTREEDGRRKARYEATMVAPYEDALAQAPAIELEDWLHVSFVCAHPGRPGAGAAALRKACDLADSHALPMLLEAVCHGFLVSYYAKFGFRAVNWEGANSSKFSEQVLNRQGWVLMWRPAAAAAAPPPQGEEGAAEEAAEGVAEEAEEAAPAEEPDLTALMASIEYAREDVPGDVVKRQMFKYRRTPIKLEAIHVSREVEEHVYSRLAWLLVKGVQTTVVDACTWALEVGRLLKAGRGWAGCFFTLPTPAEVAAALAAQQVKTATAGRGSHTSSSSGAGLKRPASAQGGRGRDEEGEGGEVVMMADSPTSSSRSPKDASTQMSPWRVKGGFPPPSPPPPSAAPPVSTFSAGGITINVYTGGTLHFVYPGFDLRALGGGEGGVLSTSSSGGSSSGSSSSP